MKVISNSSPIILLNNVDRLNILQSLYNNIIIPNAVYREVFEAQKKIEKPEWIKIKKTADERTANFLMNRLGPGESEAIVLSLEIKADLLLLDDYRARTYANSIGLMITGVAGIILDAKDKGLIRNVKEILDDLVKFGCRISGTLYYSVLEKAGE